MSAMIASATGQGNVAFEKRHLQFVEGLGNILLRDDQFAVNNEDLDLVGKSRALSRCGSSGRSGRFSRNGTGSFRCCPDARSKPVPCSLQPFLETRKHVQGFLGYSSSLSS